MLRKIRDVIGFTVIVYGFAYMLMLLGICFPRILAEYGSADVSKLAESISLPLDIFSWGFLAICSGYAGVDRKVLYDKSALSVKPTFEDTHKLLVVILMLVLILIESFILNLFLSHDYITYSAIGKQTFKGIELPLEGIATALVSTLTIYVTGTPIKKGEKTDEKTSSPVDDTNASNDSSVR